MLPLIRFWPLLLLAGCALRQMVPGGGVATLPDAVLARTLYKQLVETRTTQEEGTTQAVKLASLWLRQAGFARKDVQIVGPDPRKLNLVARLRGSGARRPLLLLAHLDVVAAPQEEGQPDPFTLRERGGYFYGRGTLDDKAMAAIWLATMIRLKREGFQPDRDLILALTADEEEGEDNGVLWLLEHHRDLIDAAYCLNEGGAGEMRQGRYLVLEVQVGEKLEVTFDLSVRATGGNSAQPGPSADPPLLPSVDAAADDAMAPIPDADTQGEPAPAGATPEPTPPDDNAIYRLAAGLSRLAAYRFPLRTTALTRAYFGQAALAETGQRKQDLQAAAWPGPAPPDPQALLRLAAASSFYNALLRDTCTVTQIEGGHGESALPEQVRATLNCRLLPDERVEDLQSTLFRVLADPRIQIEEKHTPRRSPPSPLLPELMNAVEEIARKTWPGQASVIVAPTMLPAATDGLFLRSAGVPTYGVSGLFVEIDEAPEHGRNERLGVRQFHEGREFLYQLVKRLSG